MIKSELMELLKDCSPREEINFIALGLAHPNTLSAIRTIYAIQHNVTGRIYVGRTYRRTEERIEQHMQDLRAHRHTNQLMQADYDAYGADYTFFELEKVPYEDADKEIEWMDKLNTGDPKVGYNCRDPHFRRQREGIVIHKAVPRRNDMTDER